jgi:uncharacterized protein
MTNRARMKNPVVRALVWLLHCYQRYISPGLPPTCRFSPTCSAYAIEALQVHGVLGGLWRALWRLLRCAPWHPGGIDPVPPRRPRAAPWSRSAWKHPEEQAPC